MKNLIILFAAIFATQHFLAQTQVNEKNIIGKWKIVKLEIPNQVTADVEKGKIILAKAIDQELKKNPESQTATENLFKGMLETLKASYMDFGVNNKYTGISVNGNSKGKYELNLTNQTITITGQTTTGNITNALIAFEKDGKLKISQVSTKDNKKLTAIITLKK